MILFMMARGEIDFPSSSGYRSIYHFETIVKHANDVCIRMTPVYAEKESIFKGAFDLW